MTYVRLYEVLNVAELSLIKLSLNKEGVDFRVQHENTLQLSSAYAMGNSGAILEVREPDIPLAIEVLKEVGIDLEASAQSRFIVLEVADQIIENIPGLRDMEGSLRYFVFFVSLAIILFLSAVAMLV